MWHLQHWLHRRYSTLFKYNLLAIKALIMRSHLHHWRKDYYRLNKAKILLSHTRGYSLFQCKWWSYFVFPVDIGQLVPQTIEPLTTHSAIQSFCQQLFTCHLRFWCNITSDKLYFPHSILFLQSFLQLCSFPLVYIKYCNLNIWLFQKESQIS